MKIKMVPMERATEAIAEAVGAQPGDTIEIRTPQFEREPGVPSPTAAHAIDFEALREFDFAALRAIGCRAWNNPNEPDDEFAGRVLMLFPGEWYERIPNGFEVVDIFNRAKPFVRGETDDDIRFGCLPFGLTVEPQRKVGSE